VCPISSKPVCTKPLCGRRYRVPEASDIGDSRLGLKDDRGLMSRLVAITLVGLAVLSSRSSRKATAPTKDQGDVVKFAQSAAVRALDFEQGKLQSLLDAGRLHPRCLDRLYEAHEGIS
jgi:hypothetical protein